MALNQKDLVYSNDNGNLQAGGFNVHSHLLQNNLSAISVNSDINTMANQKGGSVAVTISSVLDGLAVPAGLLYLQQNYNNNTNESKKETMTSGLYDKLVSLASQKSHSVTKKNKRSLLKPSSSTKKYNSSSLKTKRNIRSIRKNKTKRK